MTLNIVILGNNQVHLGADMRLTEPNDGRILTDSSPKLFTMQEWGWHGVATYCGIGRWANRHTSEWIKGWVKNERCGELSFDDIATIIHRNGNAWLRTIAASSGYRGAHSFVLAGVVRGNAKLVLLSNYDSLRGPRATARGDLRIERWSGARAFAFGAADAVLHGEMKALRARLAEGSDAGQIQLAIARTISRASQRNQSSGSVSSNCYTYSILAKGDTQGAIHGQVRGPIMFPSLQVGSDPMSMLRQAFGSGFQAIPVGGATFDAATPNLVQTCQSSVDAPHEKYFIDELAHLGSGSARPTAINKHGVVLGYSGHRPNGPLVGCIWASDGGITQLPLGSGATWAMDINDHGEVAGTLTIPDGGSRAFRWSSGTLEISGTLGGYHSNAHSINNQGAVVGSSWTVPGNTPGDKRELALLWPRGGELLPLGTPIDGWNSRANWIAHNGSVVGMGLSPGFPGPGAVSFLWSGDRGMMPLVIDGVHAPPIQAMDRKGVTFVVTVPVDGSPTTLLFRNGQPIVPVTLPTGSNVTAISNLGTIAYNRMTPEGRRAFVWYDGTESRLPSFKNHQAEALAINDQGTIAGHIWRSGHRHAVLWKPATSSPQ